VAKESRVPAADLQTLVAELEERGWLQRIATPVDPALEITEITQRVGSGGPTSGRSDRPEVGPPIGPPIGSPIGGPALLFEHVRGSAFPLLINTFGTRERMCLALGCRDFEELAARVRSLLKPEIPATLLQKLKKLPELAQLASLPPKIVQRGVCQEVVHTDDADLLALPALKCWPQDGGRYITLGSVFTKNPATGERNVGLYRVQLFEPKLAAMHWHMHHDGARHFRLYQQRGQRMPVAIALGGPAVLPYAATCPLPPGMDEGLFAGFLQGQALELVPAVTQPEIEVPATAEIVIEGFIDPREELILEGPFGDHTGFYSLPDYYPRFHVTAITHRQRPIYPATVVGKPPQEDYWLGKATERIFLPLLQALAPDILDYDLPLFGCFHNCAFVKIRKEYPFQARRVMYALWGAGQMSLTKIIVVVDEHVDVHDQNEVLFQLCSNVDPRRDIVLVDGPLDILDHAAPVCGVGSKLGIDATRKIVGEGPVRAWPDELRMSPEVIDLVTRRWREYGL
jgi:4-hydroxy-3-polyprenylbenzoate decarboxylase